MKTTIYKNYITKNICSSTNQTLNETDELIKSFALSLQIPKGAFILDNELGSYFFKNIRNIKANNLKTELLTLLKEEALNFQLINVENVEYSIIDSTKTILLHITISVKKDIYLLSMEAKL